MKNLILLLPLFLAACSGEPKEEVNVPDQHTTDSLLTIIDANNEEIRNLINDIPKLNGVLLPQSNVLHSGESYEAQVGLAGRFTFDRHDVITIDNAELPKAGNVGVYRTTTATKEGAVVYNGVVKVEAPDGTSREIPFTGSYYVSASAPEAIQNSTAPMDSIFPAMWGLKGSAFPGHEQDYKSWVISTLRFREEKGNDDMDSYQRTIARQDSIIEAFTKAPVATLKFDSLVVVVCPVSAVVKPGDPYVAFIYLAGLSTTMNVELREGNSSEAINNGSKIKRKPGGTGVQHYTGVIWFEDANNQRDSIVVSSNYFVE